MSTLFSAYSITLLLQRRCNIENITNNNKSLANSHIYDYKKHLLCRRALTHSPGRLSRQSFLAVLTRVTSRDFIFIMQWTRWPCCPACSGENSGHIHTHKYTRAHSFLDESKKRAGEINRKKRSTWYNK